MTFLPTIYMYMYLQVMSGIHRGPPDLLFDLGDGDILKSHPIFNIINENALQIIGYYDEVTITNPLMSRANSYKIGKYIVLLHQEWNVKTVPITRL